MKALWEIVKEKGNKWGIGVFIGLFILVVTVALVNATSQSLFDPSKFASKDEERQTETFDANSYGIAKESGTDSGDSSNQTEGSEAPSSNKETKKETGENASSSQAQSVNRADPNKNRQESNQSGNSVVNVNNESSAVGEGETVVHHNPTEGETEGSTPSSSGGESVPATSQTGGESVPATSQTGGEETPGESSATDTTGTPTEGTTENSTNPTFTTEDNTNTEIWSLSGISTSLNGAGNTLYFSKSSEITEENVRKAIQVKEILTSSLGATKEQVITNYTVSFSERVSTLAVSSDENFFVFISYSRAGVVKTVTIPAVLKGETTWLSDISVTVPGELTFALNDTISAKIIKDQLGVVAHFDNGSSKTVTDYSISLSSGLENVKKAGIYSFVVSYSDAGITKSKTLSCTITAENWNLQSLSVKPSKEKVVFPQNATIEEDNVKSQLEVIATFSSPDGKNEQKKTVTTYKYSVENENPVIVGNYTMTVSYTYKGVTKKVTLVYEIETAYWVYTGIEASGTPKFYEGEYISGTAIKKFLTVTIIKRSSDNKYVNKRQVITNYVVDTGGLTKANSATGSFPIKISYTSALGMANEISCEVTAKIYKKKLILMYDENTELLSLYTNSNSVQLNDAYTSMCKKLTQEGKYGTNDAGYLISQFSGWTEDSTPTKNSACAGMNYDFPTGFNRITLYPIPLVLLEDNGYLIQNEDGKQVLVGYTGQASTIDIPYGVTDIAMNDGFITGSNTAKVITINIPDTVVNADVSAAAQIYPKLIAYDVSSKNIIYSSDENGYLYRVSDEDKILYRVPSSVTKVVVDLKVTKIDANTFANCDNLKQLILPLDEIDFLSDFDFKQQIQIVVPDSDEDFIYKHFVGAYWKTIDSLFGEGAAARYFYTEKQAQNQYIEKDGALYQENGTKLAYLSNKASSELTLSKELTVIQNHVFIDALSLKKINAVAVNTQNLQLGKKLFGDNPPSNLKIYIYEEMWQIWYENLSRDYGEEKAKSMLVISSDGDVYTDTDGCVYSKNTDTGNLTLLSTPLTLISYAAPKNLTVIGANAFKDNQNLVWVSLPEVQVIKDNAFANCSALEILIADSEGLNQVSSTAFTGCDALETVLFNNYSFADKFISSVQVATKQDGYFAENGLIYQKQTNGVSLVNVPTNEKIRTAREDLTIIKKDAFCNCSNIIYLEFPNVITIEAEAFSGCSALEIIVLPSLTEVDKNEFAFCKLLETILLKNNTLNLVTSADKVSVEDGYRTINQMIYLCNAKEKTIVNVPTDTEGIVSLEDGVTGVGQEAFYQCTKIKQVEFGDKVEIIDDYAFSYSGVEQIVLPSSLTHLGTEAFSYCNQLERITVDGTQLVIKDAAIAACEALTEVIINGTIESMGANNFVQDTKLTTVIINGKIKELGEGSFYQCAKLVNVTINGEVNKIGGATFRECTSLAQINWETKEAKEALTFIDMVAFYKDTSWIEGDFSEFINLQTISEFSFSGCTALTQVTLPANIQSIQKSAFSNSTAITNINLLACERLNYIGESAFFGCSALTDITLPDSVQTIEKQAFCQCVALEKIILPENLQIVGSYAFYQCISLSSISLSKNIKVINEYTFANCTRLVEVDFSLAKSLETIGARVFANCTSLRNLDLTPLEQLSSIGTYAFYGNTSLTRVKFNANLQTIDTYAFAYDTSLVNLDFSQATNLTAIGNFSFWNCTELETVDLSSTKLTAINAGLFYNNSTTIPALKCVQFPETTTSIGANQFFGCTNLQSLIIKSKNLCTIAASAITACRDNEDFNVYVPYSENHSIRDAYRSDASWTSAIGINNIEKIQDSKNLDSMKLFENALYSVDEEGNLTLVQILSNSNSFRVYGESGKITYLSKEAFAQINNLTFVYLPEEVKTIPVGCFASNTSLEAMIIEGDSMPITEGDIFLGGKANENFRIYLESNLQEENLTWNQYPVYQLGDSYKTINGILYAYQSTNNDQILAMVPHSYEGSFTPEASTTIIAESAAEGCNKITDFVSAVSIVTIGKRAFANCTGLVYMNLTNFTTTKLYTLGDEAFAGCTKLVGMSASSNPTTVQLSSVLREIGKGIFKDCTSLKKVTYSSYVDYIPDEICSGCISLTDFTYSNTALAMIETVGERAFYNCKNFNYVSLAAAGALKTIKKEAYANCSKISLVTVPVTMESLEDRAFTGCSNLQIFSSNAARAVKLGEDVFDAATIERLNVFVPLDKDKIYQEEWQIGYPKLAEKITSLTSTYRAVSGILYAVDDDNASYLTAMKAPTEIAATQFYHSDAYALYTIGINNYTLQNCKNITKFTITDLVSNIGNYAFANCSNLTTITMKSIVLTKIGDYAFENCVKLTALTLPDVMVKTGKGMLSGCENLQTFTVESYVPPVLGEHLFGDALPENLVIEVPAVSYEKYIERWGKQLDEEYGKGTSNCIKGSVTEDGLTYKYIDSAWTLVSCDDSLKVASVREGTKAIASLAFANCSKLEEITFTTQEAPVLLGDFGEGLDGLTKIWVPDSYNGENDPIYNQYLSSWGAVLTEKYLSCLDTKDGAAARKYPEESSSEIESTTEAESETTTEETSTEETSNGN